MNNSHAWNYIGQNGGVAIVALQHNRRNGDLVVFYGKELLWAERAVRESKVIPFFIDDELCNIHIEYQADGRILYEFEIDRKTDTPLNRIRKTEERKGFLQGLGFLGGIVGILALILGSGFLYNQYADAKALRETGRDVVAKIEIFPTSTGKNCAYTFIYMQVPCTYYTTLRKLGDSLVLPCGLPAHSGDAVMLRYDPAELTNHTVNWDEITPECTLHLINRTRDRLHAVYPHLPLTQTECLARMAHRLGGFSALADMYYGDQPIFSNLYHNKMTFSLQQQRPDFRDDVGECF